MYAVVDIKGFQYKLEKGETLRVPKFDTEVGKKVKLSDVLFIADGDKYSIGQPTIEGAVVEATVTDQGKYGKIIVFKKKRRKDYSVKRGHRQDFTELSIDSIKVSGAKKAKKTAAEKPAKIKDTETIAKPPEEITDTETKAQEKAPESPVKKAKAHEKAAPDTQAAPKKADSAVTSGKTDKASGAVKTETKTKKTETKTKKTETKVKKTETKKPDAAKAAQAKSESTDTSE